MALPDPGVWGIDLGQAGLKAIRMKIVDGTVTATAFDYVEHPKILSQPDADPDQLTREALVKFLSRNSVRGDTVCISVPGQSGLARFVKLPPVEEKKIADIVRFEAKQQIPFNLEEVVWDYQKIGAGTVTDGFALDTEIGLFAIKRDMVGRALQYFQEQNVDVHIIQMAPLALCNFIAFDLLGKGSKDEAEPELGNRKCVVALDAGSDSSNLVITDGERIIWQRPIPLGGNHFTRALTKELKLTFAKAEHLKRNATKSPELKKILAALKPVLNDFVGEVQRSLGYFTNTHKDAQIDYMMGLGNAFRLPGLQRFLQEKLQLDVRRMAKFDRIGGDSVLTAPVFSENVATYAVAAGLALQGLNKARLVTNLLPSEIRLERLIRAKKPWAATAAACLLLGTGAVAWSFQMEYQAYGSPLVEEQVEKSKGIVKRVGDAEANFNNAKAEATKEETAVKAIVAGQAEHLNWLELTRFISDAIPRPDGSNLPKSASTYWEDRPKTEMERKDHPDADHALPGRDAYEEFKKRQAGIKPILAMDQTKDDLGVGIDDLIQFNIEAVDARFCDDLPGYWNNVKDKLGQAGSGFVRPQEHWTKPPTGNGWVVELRGYTYHYKKTYFIMDTLLESIAELGIVPPAGGAPGTATPGNPTVATAPPSGPGVPATKPVTPAPASPAPAPAAAAGANVAAGQPAPSGSAAKEHPVINRVSHVVLYHYNSKKISDPGPTEIVGNSSLAELIHGGAGATSGGTTGAPPTGTPPVTAAGGGSRDSWTPLSGGAGSGTRAATPTFASRGNIALGEMGKRGGFGRGREEREREREDRRGSTPMVRPPTAAPARLPTATDNESTTGKHWRTEFIVLFIWQEVTPSDALRQAR